MSWLKGHRFWMHSPVGVINGLAFIVAGPAIGFALLIGFLVYEVWQDVRGKGSSDKDIIGWLVGLNATVSVYYCYHELQWML